MYSDIGIDDVQITQGACGNPGDCDFEKDTCNWVNTNSGDQFDWLRQKGQTSSTRTGPNYDHTIGSLLGKDGNLYYKWVPWLPSGLSS